MQLRRIVAITFFIGKGSPVMGGVRFANKDIAEEEANDPHDNEAHDPIDDNTEGNTSTLCKDPLIKKHEAQLDQPQCWDLHQFNRPQDL